MGQEMRGCGGVAPRMRWLLPAPWDRRCHEAIYKRKRMYALWLAWRCRGQFVPWPSPACLAGPRVAGVAGTHVWGSQPTAGRVVAWGARDAKMSFWPSWTVRAGKQSRELCFREIVLRTSGNRGLSPIVPSPIVLRSPARYPGCSPAWSASAREIGSAPPA
jgi:hypothetical protein